MILKKEYYSPELELTLISFEAIMDTVADSKPEGSGWDDDDEREE